LKAGLTLCRITTVLKVKTVVIFSIIKTPIGQALILVIMYIYDDTLTNNYQYHGESIDNGNFFQ
jgi:hypothetical protein